MKNEYLILQSLCWLLGTQGSIVLFFISSLSLSYLITQDIEKLTTTQVKTKDLPQSSEKLLILKNMWRYSIETAASTQAVPGTFLITYPSVRSIRISKLGPFKVFNRVKNQIDFYQCLKSCQCQLTHLTLAQETISLTFICYCVDVNRQKNNLKTFIFMTDRHNRQL